MKPVLALALALALAVGIGAALAATTAFAQASAQPSAPSSFEGGTPFQGVQSLRDSPYRGPDVRLSERGGQCFNGKRLTGVNRSGETVVFVQARGPIYRLELSEGCEALNAANKIAVRSSRGDLVCDGSRATLVARTPSGAKQCRVKDVRRLTAEQVAQLAVAERR